MFLYAVLYGKINIGKTKLYSTTICVKPTLLDKLRTKLCSLLLELDTDKTNTTKEIVKNGINIPHVSDFVNGDAIVCVALT